MTVFAKGGAKIMFFGIGQALRVESLPQRADWLDARYSEDTHCGHASLFRQQESAD